jgi:CheY-like chemotaxis protein
MPPPTRPALRVLAVDDTPDMADCLAMFARLWGHEARTAYDPATALDRAEAFRPNLVLLDLQLPGLDGFGLAKKLRQLLPDVVIIAVTGQTGQDVLDRSRNEGFAFYLNKPVDAPVLKELLSIQQDLLGQ